jgi:hypothetical protein
MPAARCIKSGSHTVAAEVASRTVASGRKYPGTPCVAFLVPVSARSRPVIAKPQNHPAVPGKDDALTVMLDEPEPLEFT